MLTSFLFKRLILLSVIAGVLFLALALLVSTGATKPFDEATLLYVNSHADNALDTIFVFLTQLGGVYVIGAVVAALSIYFLVRKEYYKLFFVAASVGGISLINVFLKTIFERSRPDLWERLVSELSFSFPSGHSAASIALALSIIGVLWATKWRYTALIVGSLYVLIIGTSRMYLGVHYPTDVLGGWLLGITWVSLVAIFAYVYSTRKKRHEA